MKTQVLKNESRIAFKNSYTLKDLFNNWSPSNGWENFGRHIMVTKNGPNPSMATKIIKAIQW
jgi:N-acyl-D-aspartate/D-glutamate deacylase